MSASSQESPFEPPGWLKTHPEMQRRGLDLCECLKPTFVYQTSPLVNPVRVVKILDMDEDDHESMIYELLQRDKSPRNPILPCELIGTKPKPVLLMPCVPHIRELQLAKGPLSDLLGLFIQVVDGVRFLHDQRIAHMDICHGNTLVAREEDSQIHKGIVAGKVYLIDFHTSRQLSSGPGVQRAIRLPCTQVPPPPGVERLDPYSWDVYCLGRLLEELVKNTYRAGTRPPRAVHRAIDWLVGEERGCAGVCRCRPTAHQAYWVLTILRWAVRAAELCGILPSRIRQPLPVQRNP
ncbi:hypothetical protein C8Q77DRAFT_1125892 [Trametes polyzona]|nr:hypothetical protein C8Q77DRAFT_1125892 [Trametes polyzona]